MMDKINELLNEATKIDKEVNGEKEIEKRERELMEEEKMDILNGITTMLDCRDKDAIDEVEKLLLVERWLFAEAREPVRSEALKWLSKFGYKEDE